jgi:hypothetical protein
LPPEAGQVTSSDQDHSSWSKTHFLGRFQVWRGKFNVLPEAFTMLKCNWSTRSGSGDVLQPGLFKLLLDPLFEQIPNLKREIWYPTCSIHYTPKHDWPPPILDGSTSV